MVIFKLLKELLSMKKTIPESMTKLQNSWKVQYIAEALTDGTLGMGKQP